MGPKTSRKAQPLRLIIAGLEFTGNTRRSEDGKSILIYCDQTKSMTSCENPEEIYPTFQDFIETYLGWASKSNKLESFLRKCGFSV